MRDEVVGLQHVVAAVAIAVEVAARDGAAGRVGTILRGHWRGAEVTLPRPEGDHGGAEDEVRRGLVAAREVGHGEHHAGDGVVDLEDTVGRVAVAVEVRAARGAAQRHSPGLGALGRREGDEAAVAVGIRAARDAAVRRAAVRHARRTADRAAGGAERLRRVGRLLGVAPVARIRARGGRRVRGGMDLEHGVGRVAIPVEVGSLAGLGHQRRHVPG